MLSHWTLLATASVLSLSTLLQYPPDPAVPAHPGGAAATSQPATQPSGGETAPVSGGKSAALPAGVLDPANDAMMETAAQSGARIKVQGAVASASWSRTGTIMHINFQDESGKAVARGKGVVAVVFEKNKAAFDKAFDGDFAKALDGKTVEIDGKVTVYRRDGQAPVKQIQLDNPTQIKIVK